MVFYILTETNIMSYLKVNDDRTTKSEHIYDFENKQIHVIKMHI